MGLCTLEAVKLQAVIESPASDERITELIAMATAVICEHAGREFEKPAAPQARVFHYDGSGRLRFSPYDVQTVTLVELDTDTASPSTLPAGDWRVGPKPAIYGVYEWLELNAQLSGRWRTREVRVTGTWGFPSVPAAVEHACVVTVRSWLTREAGFAFADDPAGVAPPGPANIYWLPASARHLLRPFTTPVLA